MFRRTSLLPLAILLYVKVLGEIAIYPAENQTVLPGMAVTYFCRNASLGPDEFVNIQVNGTTLNPDYDPNIVIGDDYSVTFEMLAGNTTTVQCVISDGSSVPLASSVVATIYIAGPPLSPSPRFHVQNTSSLQVSWEKPFTWPEVADITHYRLQMYNSTSHVRQAWTITARCNATHASVYLGRYHAVEYSQNNGTCTVNVSYYVTILADWTPQSCHALVFYVSAVNAIGESDALAIRGAFEIALDWDAKSLSLAPLHGADGTRNILATVQPPKVCNTQILKYSFNISAKGTLLLSLNLMTYADDNPFTYLIKGLNPDTISEDYDVTLKVETMLHSASISGSVSFNHSPSFELSTCDISLIISGAVWLVVIFIVSIVIGILLWKVKQSSPLHLDTENTGESTFHVEQPNSLYNETSESSGEHIDKYSKASVGNNDQCHLLDAVTDKELHAAGT